MRRCNETIRDEMCLLNLVPKEKKKNMFFPRFLSSRMAHLCVYSLKRLFDLSPVFTIASRLVNRVEKNSECVTAASSLPVI